MNKKLLYPFYLALIIGFFFFMFITKPNVSESSENEVVLYILDVGEIWIQDGSTIGNIDTTSVSLSNTAFLIRHQNGDLLWDTGHPDSIANSKVLDFGTYAIKMDRSLSSQLGEIGVTPSEVDYLALSHGHPDHSGNAGMFMNATRLIQLDTYDGSKIDEFKPSIAKDSIRFYGDYDVFGDGKVVIKRAAGHTKDHSVLYVELAGYGPVILSGDLFITSEQRQNKGVPIFNADSIQTLKSMGAIEEFIQEKNATLWIQHDIAMERPFPNPFK